MNRLAPLYHALAARESVSYDRDTSALLLRDRELTPTFVSEVLTLTGNGEKVQIVSLDAQHTLVSYSGTSSHSLRQTIDTLHLPSLRLASSSTPGSPSSFATEDFGQRVFDVFRQQLRKVSHDNPYFIQQSLPAGDEIQLLPVLQHLADWYAGAANGSFGEWERN